MPEHIVRSFDEELAKVKELIAAMGGLAEAQLSDATEALARRDTVLADRVVKADAKVDAIEIEVESLTVSIIARRQPVAIDLRGLVSAIKIASEIERIADYAANIAKRTFALSQSRAWDDIRAVVNISRLAEGMIRDVLDAYLRDDVALAIDVWHRDEEVDGLYTNLFRSLLTYMMEDARNITACTHLLFVAKNLERIGDHATNIAEMVHYVVRGHPLAEKRPKRDTSSFELGTALGDKKG
ncbi:MAG: phosphate signaling complex protein PhoU [Alphaproteobacteria bacterium]|nr:phosphate signaling complex protein PhoU [Alphaproteobacteria bacterium]